MESGKTKSVEASEIAAFSAIESGSQRRAIPDVSTALLRMISDDGQIQFRSDDGRRFPATYCAGPIASEPVTQRSGQGPDSLTAGPASQALSCTTRPPMPSIHPLMTLFVLAIPIACIAWTVTHEEVFREPRDWCQAKCQNCPSIYQRKFFYLFTCEYCFSHYVTLGFLFITRYRLLYDDWRGYVIAGFSLVWVANVYMSAFGRLRLDIKHERVEIGAEEAVLDGKAKAQEPAPPGTPRPG